MEKAGKTAFFEQVYKSIDEHIKAESKQPEESRISINVLKSSYPQIGMQLLSNTSIQRFKYLTGEQPFGILTSTSTDERYLRITLYDKSVSKTPVIGIMLPKKPSLEVQYERILRQIDSLGIPREYVARRLVEKLPYEDFVSLTYRSLERHGRTPIDLTYDLLNEMARELYRSASNATENREFDFRARPAEEIKFLRQHLGISQRRLAKALNFSSSTAVRDVENKKYIPTLKKIYEFLEALDSLR